MRYPKFVDERSRKRFRYGAVIAFSIGMGSLAATHRGVSEFVKRDAQNTRISSGHSVGTSRDRLVVRSAR